MFDISSDNGKDTEYDCCNDSSVEAEGTTADLETIASNIQTDVQQLKVTYDEAKLQPSSISLVPIAAQCCDKYVPLTQNTFHELLEDSAKQPKTDINRKQLEDKHMNLVSGPNECKGIDDEPVANSLLTRLASADGERKKLDVVTDGLRVTLAEIENVIGQLPPDRAVAPRQILKTLRPMLANFLTKENADRTIEEGKTLMQRTMQVMQMM